MDLQERRLWWVKYLADQMGREKLAQKLGYQDTNYLNQVIGGHVNLGNGNAKKWQRKLQLSEGWFDRIVPGDNDPQTEVPDVEIYDLHAMVRELGPEKFAEEVAQLADVSPKEMIMIAQHFLALAVDDL